jgi:uncharacterized hydrophobic protein (TIGR00271 family)
LATISIDKRPWKLRDQILINKSGMARNPDGWLLARKWRQLKADWAPYRDQKMLGADLAQQMGQASIPSFDFFFLLGLAAAIATFGLVVNSAPAIIGAMIIAPLMAPIMSLSFGLVAFERRLIGRSIITLIAGVILVVVVAYLITISFGLRIVGSEILNRTSPTLIDLAVAMAAGGAAAFAHTRRSIISSIAGVAIAVALVPPLAVSGIGLALGRSATAEGGLSLSEFGLFSGGTDVAAGAFVLFLTNLIGIVAVAILVFVSQRYGEWKKALLGMLLFVGLSAILIQPLNQAFRKIYVENRVVRVLHKLVRASPELFVGAATARIESIRVTYKDDLLHVNIDALVSKDALAERSGRDRQERLDLIQESLAADIQEPVVLELDLIPVEM